jgi:hypothetical protein
MAQWVAQSMVGSDPAKTAGPLPAAQSMRSAVNTVAGRKAENL